MEAIINESFYIRKLKDGYGENELDEYSNSYQYTI